MLTPAEELLASVFQEDAERARPVDDLYARVLDQRAWQRRRRRRAVSIAGPAMAVAAAVSVVVVAGLGSPSGPPTAGQPRHETVAVTDIGAVRGHLSDARLTGVSLRVGDHLGLSPSTSTPRATETEALRFWAAGPPGSASAAVSYTTVFLADVSLDLPASLPSGSPLSTVDLPAFHDRPAWVILWQGAPTFCPNATRSGAVAADGTSPTAIREVQLVAADGSGESLTYVRGGPPCAPDPGAEQVTVSTYSISLPWTADAGAPATVTVERPVCAVLGGAVISGRVLAVSASMSMTGATCEGAVQESLAVGGDATDLDHAPTGRLAARVSLDAPAGGVRFFDGVDKTLSP
jgi:hypothetical protein